MLELTSIERMQQFLKRQPHDRIPIYEHFWDDTKKGWVHTGQISDDVDIKHHFNYDMTSFWAFNYIADLDFEPQVLEETEDTILILDGNGAKLKTHKKHDSTPEHVGFSVTERQSWSELKEKIISEKRRISIDKYLIEQKWAKDNNKFFCWSGINIFEIIARVCGHENMLIGMALDPEWIHDMSKTYMNLTLSLLEELFSIAGLPDGIWFYEDMGFKQRPFMSPAMYDELIKPYHKKINDFAHSLGLPIIMHSCGYIEPLLPGMIESGIDCLQAIEVKSGMDTVALYEKYGDEISLMGGMDIRQLYTNDKSKVEQELKSKLPYIMGKNGYALHSDHSIPNTVDLETYEFFIEKGLELGTY